MGEALAQGLAPAARPGPAGAGRSLMTAAGLKKAYGGRVVLDVDRVDLVAGEILAIMGPSGSGKTTLLRLLATLEAPTEGEVSFGPWRWGAAARPPLAAADLVRWRRRLAFVPQNPVLFSGAVRENVALGLELRAVDRAEIRVRVGEALAMVGLADLAEAPVGCLSAGEVQRVALARAFVTRPEVLLLDEPTANLDPANVTAVEQAVVRAMDDWRPAILVVTHNLFQARRVAGRTGLLVSGKLVEIGETRQVFERPRDPRAAQFVRGEMVF